MGFAKAISIAYTTLGHYGAEVYAYCFISVFLGQIYIFFAFLLSGVGVVYYAVSSRLKGILQGNLFFITCV